MTLHKLHVVCGIYLVVQRFRDGPPLFLALPDVLDDLPGTLLSPTIQNHDSRQPSMDYTEYTAAYLSIDAIQTAELLRCVRAASMAHGCHENPPDLFIREVRTPPAPVVGMQLLRNVRKQGTIPYVIDHLRMQTLANWTT